MSEQGRTDKAVINVDCQASISGSCGPCYIREMKHTKATLRKLSLMRRGENNPFFGKKHSPETIAAMRARALLMQYNSRRTYALQPITIKELSSNEWAYVAGLVDGEGSIAIRRDQAQISIYNCYLPLMKFLSKSIGGNYRVAHRNGRTPNYCWNIGGAKNIDRALARLLPFLIIKREKAVEVLAWLHKKYPGKLDGKDNYIVV